MTTITIENGEKLRKTKFRTAKELYIYLRNKLSPVSIYLVDDEEIPESILKNIEKAEQEGEDDAIDFKG
ncbi:MAG: hypothetical protein DRJ02_10220 [Bacteroidetes bacterium]|nr:MAG: hypothetical protein DRI72_10140 [Bacteroidota bacterium]RLD72242.1 MAG: hypothetical protein DRI87_05930 [Bacteroidota bacterium]RLD85539.1 MAG: hypothetical protein DRJ02_10220 [Bacteroidota bacterium]